MERQKDTGLFEPPVFAGIFGSGIKYSLSPLIHSAMSKLSGANLCYGSFDIPPEKFADAFNGFKTLKMKGANITQPYKSEALKYIDSLSGEAELIGAANTVNREEDGSYRGYNTDIAGFVKAVDYEFKTNLNGKRIMLLGAGGASRAVLYAGIKEGARDIFIINRSRDRARELKENADLWKMRLKSPSAISYSDFNLNDIPEHLLSENWDIVVNAITPSDESALPVKRLISGLGNFSEKTFLIDISYSPGQTRFLKLFEGKRLKSANGLSMLFFQAIESFYIWTGKRVDFNVLKEALRGVF